jgi:hypothetical protein
MLGFPYGVSSVFVLSLQQAPRRVSCDTNGEQHRAVKPCIEKAFTLDPPEPRITDMSPNGTIAATRRASTGAAIYRFPEITPEQGGV